MTRIDSCYASSAGIRGGCEPRRLVIECNHSDMQLFSLFLLAAGWFLVVAAIALLRPGFLALFVVAGLLVELLGLGLLARAHASAPASSLSRQERKY
jgi:hypothetical protein